MMIFLRGLVRFWSEEVGCVSNYWLNAISFPNKELKYEFLDFTIERHNDPTGLGFATYLASL